MAANSCDLLSLDLRKAEALRQSLLTKGEADLAASRAKALGDGTRLQLVTALREGDELCGCDLAWIVEKSQNLVSHHLGTLRSAGLVDARRDGKMMMFSLTPAGAFLAEAVLGKGVAA